MKKEQAFKVFRKQDEVAEQLQIEKAFNVMKRKEKIAMKIYKQAKERAGPELEKQERAKKAFQARLASIEEERLALQEKHYGSLDKNVALQQSFRSNGSPHRSMNFALMDEDAIETHEIKKQLLAGNVQENKEREKKKIQFKKITIMEKQSLADQRLQQKRLEDDLVMQAKVQSKNEQVRQQMEKWDVLDKLKGKRLTDK